MPLAGRILFVWGAMARPGVEGATRTALCADVEGYPQAGVPHSLILRAGGNKRRFMQLLETWLTRPPERRCFRVCGGATLGFAELIDAGYRYVVTVGDSIINELAFAGVVLSSESNETCDHHAATLLRSIRRSDGSVSKAARVSFGSSGDGIVCDRNQLGVSCQGVARTWKPQSPVECCAASRLWHAHYDGGTFADLEAAVRALRIEVNCPCKGVIVMGSAAHDLLKRFARLPINCPTCGNEDRLDRVARYLGRKPFFTEPGGGLFARGQRVAALLDATHATYPRATIAWVPPPLLDYTVMAAEPAKVDYLNFHQFATLGLWAEADLGAASDRNYVHIVPLRAATQRYRHMSCDGMHHMASSETHDHGTSWHCAGFPQLYQVAWQAFLYRLIRNETLRLGGCLGACQ